MKARQVDAHPGKSACPATTEAERRPLVNQRLKRNEDRLLINDRNGVQPTRLAPTEVERRHTVSR